MPAAFLTYSTKILISLLLNDDIEKQKQNYREKDMMRFTLGLLQKTQVFLSILQNRICIFFNYCVKIS